jgi:hypothetical protein
VVVARRVATGMSTPLATKRAKIPTYPTTWALRSLSLLLLIASVSAIAPTVEIAAAGKHGSLICAVRAAL